MEISSTLFMGFSLILLSNLHHYNCKNVELVTSEICHLEKFSGLCDQGEIIFMKTAFYGLMTLGQCLPEAASGVGCFNDVIKYFDKVCSGKNTCSVDTVEASLQRLNVECPRHIAPYIETSYICTRGNVAQTKLFVASRITLE